MYYNMYFLLRLRHNMKHLDVFYIVYAPSLRYNILVTQGVDMHFVHILD